MIPYFLEKSSVFSSDNDINNINGPFNPNEAELYGFEIYYTLGSPNSGDHNLDLFTFLLNEENLVIGDHLYFYSNGGNQESPIAIRGDCWGCPWESDAHYIRWNYIPKETTNIMLTGFLFDANVRNQKLQDLNSIHFRFFIDEKGEDGKTLCQYTINPKTLGTQNDNIIVFAKIHREKDGWTFQVLNKPVQCDPLDFVKQYGIA